MAAAAQLTPGAVAVVLEHADGTGTLQPVLQVLAVRLINNDNNPTSERFRMMLSDGVYTLQCMLATVENVRARDGSIQKGSIIRLQQFVCSTIMQRRIVIVMKLDVLQSECDIIGNPKPYEMINQPNAAQANRGTYSSGPGMLGSSVAPRPAQVADNVPLYGGYPGMTGAPFGRAVEAVPNVASGASYGTTSAHDTINVGMAQLNLQQPPLNFHQNQRFAVPSMAAGSATLGNTYSNLAQSFYQQTPGANRRVPVAQLNPYQERWTIKVRVTAKTALRQYNNARGPGKTFSFDLLDEQGGEIRATCFNAQADQFFDIIEVDKVYMISRGTLKPAQKKFNPLNHEYEISMDFRTSIEVCFDDDSNIPRQQYNFRQISDMENIEIGDIVDLFGIVTSVGPSATITREDGLEAQKRTLQLRDMSGRSIEITLWGKFCDATSLGTGQRTALPEAL